MGSCNIEDCSFDIEGGLRWCLHIAIVSQNRRELRHTVALISTTCAYIVNQFEETKLQWIG